jgi:hypothetical protein
VKSGSARLQKLLGGPALYVLGSVMRIVVSLNLEKG